MSSKGRGQIGEEETSFRFETERIRDRTGIKRAATAATRDATITEDTTVDPLIRHLLALCSPTWLTHVFNRTLDFSFPSSTNAHPLLDSLSVLSNVHSNLRPKNIQQLNVIPYLTAKKPCLCMCFDVPRKNCNLKNARQTYKHTQASDYLSWWHATALSRPDTHIKHTPVQTRRCRPQRKSVSLSEHVESPTEKFSAVCVCECVC